MSQIEKPESTDEKIEDIVTNASEIKDVSEPEEVAAEQTFKERYYYLAAEYDNAIKRLEREKSNVVKFGNENILRDIIASIDLFELTVNALTNDAEPKIRNIVIGLEMVRKQLVDTLHRHGLEKISSLNKVFDPNLHEAVGQEQRADVGENIVIKEHQAGYLLNGRLLRAAKVTVSASRQ